MARRPGDGGRFRLSPRARQLAGWVIALLLVLGIAGAVRLLGESGDEGAVVPSPSGAGGAATLAIVFGTELSAERVVPVGARTTSFERGDTFAYAVGGGQPAEAVYRRGGAHGWRPAGDRAGPDRGPGDPWTLPHSSASPSQPRHCSTRGAPAPT